MRVFDYIPQYHDQDEEKRRIRDQGPLPDEMRVEVEVGTPKCRRLVLLRYCPALPLEEMETAWFQALAKEVRPLCEVPGPFRIKTYSAHGQQLVYLPALDDEQDAQETQTATDSQQAVSFSALDNQQNAQETQTAAPLIREETGLSLNGWETLVPADVMKDAHALLGALEGERLSGTEIYPPQEMVFRALLLTPPEKVKVVILGQDPYHGPGEACGLAFSVQEGVKIPPSLRNIFKVLQRDVGCPAPASGDLTQWAENGVLLLNTILTVEKKRPLSHEKRGWQDFTGAILQSCAQLPQPVVFLFWGTQAVDFGKQYVTPGETKAVFTSTHPSPLAANRATKRLQAFVDTSPFSQANQWLTEKGQEPVSWSLT